MFAALLLCASMGYADSPTVKTFMSGNKSVKYEVYGQELGCLSPKFDPDARNN
jgi:hypothetical protein